MAEGARLESVYTATYRGFESPPHRHILRRARTQVRAFFFACGTHRGDENPRPGFESPPHRHILRRARTQVRAFFFACGTHRGDENPRPGFDNWRSQLDRPRARERAAPQGRAKRVNPPLTAIFEMRACTQVRAFFSHVAPTGGDENPRPGFDNWQRQLDRPRARERAAPQGRAKRVNPPLTAIFEMRACTQVRALFFYILRRGG